MRVRVHAHSCFDVCVVCPRILFVVAACGGCIALVAAFGGGCLFVRARAHVELSGLSIVWSCFSFC